PIGMAFFTVREQLGELQTDSQPPVTVAYPSPAGPVMSQVDGSDWQTLIDANASIARMRTEVETLLINRTANRRQAFIVPLDVCFELVGIVRRHWQGWSGGTDVHREIDAFFERLESSAKELA
ncbi:MAG: hypothetical protein HKN47_21280, partial [Pirellulaceae bacterium]|nr:hypothetical protein [Pirellulaceae bacterium]